MKKKIEFNPILTNITTRVVCKYCAGSTQEGICKYCGGYVTSEEANKWKQWQED